MLTCLRHICRCEQQLRARASGRLYRQTHNAASRLVARARPRLDQNDVRRIPGVGNRNADILASKNVDSIPELCRLFKDDYNRDKSQFMEYLSGLGIRRRWSQAIVEYVATNVAHAERQITFCVEGNIGAGKSTYLNMIEQSRQKSRKRSQGGTFQQVQVQEEFTIVPEPVAEWQDVGGWNLLDAFYKNPERYAFTFQSYVFITRMMQEERSRAQKGFRVMERSIFCDRMVFVQAVHEARQLTQMELDIYDSFFNPLLQLNPNLTPDAFVYLQAGPETCMRRLRRRGRNEEGGVKQEYLSRLGDFHENWLVDGSRRIGELLKDAEAQHRGHGAPPQEDVLYRAPPCGGGELPEAAARITMHQVSQGSSHKDIVIPKLPRLLENNVVLLDSQRLTNSLNHPPKALDSLHMVPALHVNCDEDIDVEDYDASVEREMLMSTFRKWVQQYRDANKQFFDEKSDILRQGSRDAMELTRAFDEVRKQRLSSPVGGSLEVLNSIM